MGGSGLYRHHRTRKEVKAAILSVLGLGLSAVLAVAQPVAKPALGKWNVSIRTDVMDDSVGVFAIVDSEDADAFLSVRCWREETTIYVGWDRSVLDGAGKTITVQTRLDSDPPESSSWTVISDPSTVFVPRDKVLQIAERMAEATQLHVRVAPPNKPSGLNDLTETFDLTGVRWALMPVADACRWSWLLMPTHVEDESVLQAIYILSDFAKGVGDVSPGLDRWRPAMASALDVFFDLESSLDETGADDAGG